MVRSAAANAYRESVRACAMRERRGPLAVTLVLHPPEPSDWAKRVTKAGSEAVLSVRRFDIDNCLKVVLDALQGVAFENDKQITRLLVSLGLPIPDGGVDVTIEEDSRFAIP